MAPFIPFLLRGAIASIALFAAYNAGQKSVKRHRRRSFVNGLQRKLDELKQAHGSDEDQNVQRAIQELESLLDSVKSAKSEQEFDAEVQKFFSGEFIQDVIEGVVDVASDAGEAIWQFFDSAANALDDHLVDPLVRKMGGDKSSTDQAQDSATGR